MISIPVLRATFDENSIRRHPRLELQHLGIAADGLNERQHRLPHITRTDPNLLSKIHNNPVLPQRVTHDVMHAFNGALHRMGRVCDFVSIFLALGTHSCVCHATHRIGTGGFAWIIPSRSLRAPTAHQQLETRRRSCVPSHQLHEHR